MPIESIEETLSEGEYKIITQPERSEIIKLSDKEAELEKLKTIYANLEVTKEEQTEWAEQELQVRQDIYQKRIQEVQALIDKING